MSLPILAAGLLSSLGLASSLAIYLAHRVLPKEDPSFKTASEIKELLPGADCGACGKPGCFAYAQAVAKDTRVLTETPCRILAADDGAQAGLVQFLGEVLDDVADVTRAIIHCTGSSPHTGDYHGVQTCVAASHVGGGFKSCPFACLGLGDCAEVCPVDAIQRDPDAGPARVDWTRCIGCGLCVAACPRSLIELIPESQPQYLGCSYSPQQDIDGRGKCESGCLHCRICVRVSENKEVSWNDATNLPQIGVALAEAAIDQCPRSIIHRTP